MNTILRLFYDLTVYREIITQPFGKSLLRFILAYLILSSGYGLYVAKKYLPPLIQDFQTTTSTINATLPDQAIFAFSNYRLSTNNLPLPYQVNNNIYLDSSTEALPATSTARLTLSATAVSFRSASDTHETLSFKDLELTDFSLTGNDIKQQLTDLSLTINRLSPYLPLLLTWPIWVALLVARSLHALFYALLFLIGVSLVKGNYRYHELAKITFHSIIVAETINLAILFVYGTAYATIFSVAFIGMSILAYLSLPARLKL